MQTVKCATCLLKSKPAQNLEDSELAILGQSCVETVFEKGETIFKQDALSSNIIYLQTGLVKLMIKGPQRMQIIKLKKAPCFLGLPTTIGDKINHYSAVALEQTTACFIDLSLFKSLLRMNSDFSCEIILELCKNELDQFNRCVKLVQNQVFGRLATNLLNMANEIYRANEFDLPLSRNEFADLVCSSRETVSRLLSELNQEGIIEIRGKHIRLIDLNKLEDISRNG
ncbi:MAG: Crp/Fnr family transcriptional regulator [Bacteroidales bacterium]|nr:Crp/Fnr family transcriptional regulator [Bacteroidales bacterium]